MRSKQKLFDIVKSHLLTQMKKSVGKDGKPAYRGLNGLKCAIGCLIPDSKYNKIMEGGLLTWYSWHHKDRIVLRAIGQAGASNPTIALLISLQRLHDLSHPVAWENGLRLLAKKYQLKYEA